MARSATEKRQTFFSLTYPIKAVHAEFTPAERHQGLHDKTSSRDASEHVLERQTKDSPYFSRSREAYHYASLQDIPGGFGGRRFSMAWRRLYVCMEISASTPSIVAI